MGLGVTMQALIFSIYLILSVLFQVQSTTTTERKTTTILLFGLTALSRDRALEGKRNM